MRSTDRDFGNPDRAAYVAIATVLVNQTEFAGLTAAARANLVLQTAHLHLAAHIRRHPGNLTTCVAPAQRPVGGSWPTSATRVHSPRAPAEVGELVGGSLSVDERVEAGRH